MGPPDRLAALLRGKLLARGRVLVELHQVVRDHVPRRVLGHVDVAEGLPPLYADPQRLGQVLGNLVTNALRHTPPGGEVTLGAASVPPGMAAPTGILLWVADNGEGIPAKDLPRVFDRFWRGDPARSHDQGAGSGLGLAIAKGLVEANGGRIWAESQVGEGTTVSCLFPVLPDMDTAR